MKINKDKIKEFFAPGKQAKKYYYIKEPFSINGIFSFALGCISFFATVSLLILSVMRNGTVTSGMSAIGTVSIILSLTSLVFVYISVTEKNKKRIFSWIGGVLSLITAVIWVMLLTAG